MTVGGAMAGIASIATETTNSHVQMWQSHLTASSRARHHFSSVDNDGIRDESTDGNAVVKWHTKMYSMFSSGSPWPENERLINVVPLSFRLGNSRFFPYTQRSQLRRVEWKMEWNASVRFPWDGKITRICVDFLFFRTRNLSLFSNRFPRLITNCTRAPHRDKLSYVAKVTAAASRWSIFAHNKSKFTIYHCDWLWQQRQGMGFRVFQVPGKKYSIAYEKPMEYPTFVITTFIHVHIVFVLFVVRHHGIVIVIGLIFRLPRHLILLFESPPSVGEPRRYLRQCHLCDYRQHNFLALRRIRILLVLVEPSFQCGRRFTRCIFSASCQIVAGTITARKKQKQIQID